jgi:hypothetical protein
MSGATFGLRCLRAERLDRGALRVQHLDEARGDRTALPNTEDLTLELVRLRYDSVDLGSYERPQACEPIEGVDSDRERVRCLRLFVGEKWISSQRVQPPSE